MRRARRQRTRVAAAVVVVALLAVTVLTLAGDDGDDGVAAGRTPTSTSTSVAAVTTTSLDRADLSREARELLDLVDRGRAGTFHARYTVLSPGLGEDRRSVELEVWRRADRIRQDTFVLDATGESRTAAFGTAEGTVGCQQPPGGGWICQQVADEAFDPSQDFLSGILGLLASSTVAVTDGSVGSFAGRCFALSEAELCLSPDGVPLRIDAGGTSYEVLELDGEVSEADFVPPAPVATR